MPTAAETLPTDPLVAMRSILQRIATGPELSKDISLEEARLGMSLVLEGKVDPVQAGIFLIALRMKRETDDENKGILDAIRDVTESVTVPVDALVDIADPYDGFNRNLLVSPFLPSLLAALSVPAFSHGVVEVGPKYGATHARVLEAAGTPVHWTLSEAADRIADPKIGWAYVDQRNFCPKLHQLTELRTLIVKRPAITTVEVLAGPLRARGTNHLVTGYVHKPYPRIYAMLARHAGFDSALLVRGIEGGVLPSLRQLGTFWHYHGDAAEQRVELQPTELGIQQEGRAVPLPEGLPGYSKKSDSIGAKVDPVAVAKASAQAGYEALDGSPGPARDSLVYGAALCLWHLERCASWQAAADKAREAIDSGDALTRFRAAT